VTNWVSGSIKCRVALQGRSWELSGAICGDNPDLGSIQEVQSEAAEDGVKDRAGNRHNCGIIGIVVMG